MSTMSTTKTSPPPTIALLSGGTSAEREVSLRSGEACLAALRVAFPETTIEPYRIDTNALPAALDPRRHVVFSTLHGTFGEDGGMQRLLEAARIAYAGCDSASSALTMDKTATKHAAARAVPVIPGLSFNAAYDKPTPEYLINRFGPDLIFKPNAEGSSVGLRIIANRAELITALKETTHGIWIIEKRIHGRELAVGVLNGRAMGIVEIRPKSATGAYDYESKYTAGRADYLAPAPLDDATAARIRAHAETACTACACRDFARVDFMLADGEKSSEFRVQSSEFASGAAAPTLNSELRTLNSDGEAAAALLLEINTLPGMTELSLLPKSAACIGLDFLSLLREMLTPAIARFHLGARDFRPASQTVNHKP